MRLLWWIFIQQCIINIRTSHIWISELQSHPHWIWWFTVIPLFVKIDLRERLECRFGSKKFYRTSLTLNRWNVFNIFLPRNPESPNIGGTDFYYKNYLFYVQNLRSVLWIWQRHFQSIAEYFSWKIKLWRPNSKNSWTALLRFGFVRPAKSLFRSDSSSAKISYVPFP